jgi:nitrogen regulatory protein P-II 1
MVKIEAVIKPHKLDAVKEALVKAGVAGMTVIEVRGFGKQKGHEEFLGGETFTIEFLPKLKVEIVCPNEDQAKVIGAISNALRIRTNEKGDDAVK